MKLKLAVLRIMKNINQIKRSSNAKFKLLDVVSKYRNMTRVEEDEKKEENGGTHASPLKIKRNETNEFEEEGFSNEEVYEDYKEFKNLILQTSKIVSD